MANKLETYIIYNYGDISWTTGKASGGDKYGLGGYPAEVSVFCLYNKVASWHHSHGFLLYNVLCYILAELMTHSGQSVYLLKSKGKGNEWYILI